MAPSRTGWELRGIFCVYCCSLKAKGTVNGQVNVAMNNTSHEVMSEFGIVWSLKKADSQTEKAINAPNR